MGEKDWFTDGSVTLGSALGNGLPSIRGITVHEVVRIFGSGCGKKKWKKVKYLFDDERMGHLPDSFLSLNKVTWGMMRYVLPHLSKTMKDKACGALYKNCANEISAFWGIVSVEYEYDGVLMTVWHNMHTGQSLRPKVVV